MSLFTLIERTMRASPVVSAEQALSILTEHYGLDAVVSSLGSQQDVNFRVQADQGTYVLKLCHASYTVVELHAQQAAMAHLAAHGLPVPAVVPAMDGNTLLALDLEGQAVIARLLTYIEGEPLTRRPYLSAELISEVGRACARTDLALADFDHPGLKRTLQWDPQNAQDLISELLPILDGHERQADVASASAAALLRLQPLLSDLAWQAVHLDITDDNTLWQRDERRHWQLRGIIDFGDLVRTWRIADLSVTCAALLHHAQGDPFAILPAVQAYHRLCPLSQAEAQALWPLVIARAAVLVLSSEQQLCVAPDNTYIRDNIAHEWQIFDVATSLPPALMEAAVLGVTGLAKSLPRVDSPLPLVPGLGEHGVAYVDLGVLGPGFEAGNWEQPGLDQRLLAAHAAIAGTATSRYGEYRLSRTRPDDAHAPDSFALHVELHLPLGSPVQAPFGGTVRVIDGGRLALAGPDIHLLLTGLDSTLADDALVEPGQWLGTSRAQLIIQASRNGELVPPLFTCATRAAAWQQLCPSPEPWLGFHCTAAPLADSQQLLERRDASFARSQKHYYQTPPQIERGWRNHLIDMQGRSYLDMLNNVAVLGHSHPRMAQVAARQWSLLNTNSRFHYAAIAQFSERLLDLAPDSMDRVFLVNSGSEANDLAIRLAWAYSGGREMLSVLEAYHGWTVATDAISTSVADNPRALETRPDWVHPVMAPNSFRGPFRGPGCAVEYIKDVQRALDELATRQRQVAGFICEPVYGNAGGIALPQGYLQAVYRQVRKAGGLCIADEVQVGYGRLGHYFWGFEEQGVVPDIITLAKGMGNGHPLGAVITRREVAEALEAEGYFFSSAGASPVSCEIGLAVLDVMGEQRLQEQARDIGDYFKMRLQALMADHPLVGAVHGSGFYLGVELVRSRTTLEPASEETALLCDRLLELGIFMQPTGDHLNILKIKPPMVTTRASVDFFVDCVSQVLSEDL